MADDILDIDLSEAPSEPIDAFSIDSPSSVTSVTSKTGYKIRFSTKKLIRDVGIGVLQGLRHIAPQMEAEMKDFAPVDTGLLRSSIKVRTVRGADPRIEITTAGYGFFVENGTSKMEAQPFILPVVLKKKWIKQVAHIAKAVRRGRGG